LPRNPRRAKRKVRGNSHGANQEQDYYDRVGRYYADEVRFLESRPMWPEFDKLMRATLLSAAYRRAQDKALKYHDPVSELGGDRHGGD
jgi:hypothetical protein